MLVFSGIAKVVLHKFSWKCMPSLVRLHFFTKFYKTFVLLLVDRASFLKKIIKSSWYMYEREMEQHKNSLRTRITNVEISKITYRL